MILDFIEADNFRNLSGRISWGHGLNIIFGNNGQGKTNWLEAIYLLSRTKSFRTQRLQEGIRFGQEAAFVRGQVTSGSEVRRDLKRWVPEYQSQVRPKLAAVGSPRAAGGAGGS